MKSGIEPGSQNDEIQIFRMKRLKVY